MHRSPCRQDHASHSAQDRGRRGRQAGRHIHTGRPFHRRCESSYIHRVVAMKYCSLNRQNDAKQEVFQSFKVTDSLFWGVDRIFQAGRWDVGRNVALRIIQWIFEPASCVALVYTAGSAGQPEWRAHLMLFLIDTGILVYNQSLIPSAFSMSVYSVLTFLCWRGDRCG